MSETVLAIVLSAALLLAMFLWVPLLHVVCPPCRSFLKSRRSRKGDAVHDPSAAAPGAEAA